MTPNLKTLTRDAILGGPIVLAQDVEIAGHTVRVRELTMGEMKRVRAEFAGRETEAAEFVVKRCLLDASGARLLTDDDSVDTLGAAAVKAIVGAVMEISGGKAAGESPKA